MIDNNKLENTVKKLLIDIVKRHSNKNEEFKWACPICKELANIINFDVEEYKNR